MSKKILFDQRGLFLGVIHSFVGIIIFGSRFWGGGLVDELNDLSSALPIWSLFVAGFIKGIYWVGSIVPGTTYILIVLVSHTCSFSSTSKMIVLVWLGVLAGISASYQLGHWYNRAGATLFARWRGDVPEVPEIRRLNKFTFLMATHPNLAATYLFERGFWQRPFYPTFLMMAVAGLAVLVACSLIICSAQTVIASATNDIGSVWGLIIIGLGVWRIANAIRFERGV
jgi:hypothetical protein